MRYIIYKITNIINGKIYIGKHETNNLDDDYFGSGKILKKAIKKYGIENFTFHLEFELHNQEEMDLLEKYVVNKEFLKRKDVYNINQGGKGGFAPGFWKGRKRSAEDNLKKSIRMKINNPTKGKVGTFKGCHHTDEARKKMSEAKKGFIPWNKGKTGFLAGEKSPMWKKHRSDETKKKISLSRKGKYCGEKAGFYGKHHSEDMKKSYKNIDLKNP